MLDIAFFSSIIYIWYEGYLLSPLVVRLCEGGHEQFCAPISGAHSRRKDTESVGATRHLRDSRTDTAFPFTAKSNQERGDITWLRRLRRLPRRLPRRPPRSGRSRFSRLHYPGGTVCPLFSCPLGAATTTAASRIDYFAVSPIHSAPSQTRTRLIVSRGSRRSTTSIPATTLPNTV